MHQGEGVKEGVSVILCWFADATREAPKAMAGQTSLPMPFCGPSSPCLHAAKGEGEGEGGGVRAGGGISLCRMCVCQPTSCA